MDNNDVLEEARHAALAGNTAQNIYYEIQRLENTRQVSEQRWVWELLQNALDAAPKGRLAKVSIRWDGNIITFAHNGDAFSPEEIAHLIYHGTTKYRDPAKRGKFGRGFLVTHLLSKRVKVYGRVRGERGEFNFQIELDREGNADELKNKMDKTWEQLKAQSRQPDSSVSGQPSLYSTHYEYAVDDKGKSAVGSGIKAAKQCLPYVLAFIPELEEVRLDEPGVQTVWRKDGVLSDQGFILTKVQVIRSAEPPEVYTIVERQKGADEEQNAISIAVMLREGQPPELVPNDPNDKTPRFFAVGLPIVDTEDIPIPVVVNSRYFEPDPERTGIYAGATDTPEQKRNWEVLANIPGACIGIIKYASQQRWSGLHLLGQLTRCQGKDWLDNSRFMERIIYPVVDQITTNKEIRLVKNIQGDYVATADACVPVNDAEGKLYKLLEKWKPVQHGLVDKRLANNWAAILEGWASVRGENIEKTPGAWSAEHLAQEIAACRNLKALENKVELGQGESVINWLNEFIALVADTKHYDFLLNNYALLPDQNDALHKKGDLFWDDGIDEKLKDYAEEAGIKVRSVLLHKEIKGVKLQPKTEGDYLGELLKLRNLNSLQPRTNARFLAWLSRRPENFRHISGHPVITVGEPQKLDEKKSLLKPKSIWPQGTTEFAGLFPEDYILDEVYAEELTPDCWKVLEERGYVYRSLIYERDESDPWNCILEESIEDAEHDEKGKNGHKVALKVSDICFLEEKDKGIIDRVRKSRRNARLFIKFIFNYVCHNDHYWKTGTAAPCSCGKQHKLIPCAWLRVLKERQWVPIGGDKSNTPTAENIARLVDDSFLYTIAQGEASAMLLDRLGISVSDLALRKITDPNERLNADRLAARMCSVEPETRALLLQELEMRMVQKQVTNRNREIGTLVERLIKQALEDAHVEVKRTGLGSDYEVEYDFVENGQEQGLDIGKYLLEVKATSTNDVRMTLNQGELAVNHPGYRGYILCVCPIGSEIGSEEVTKEHVKNNSRFMFNIGDALKDPLDTANRLKSEENHVKVKYAGKNGIQLEITADSKLRFRVSRAVWGNGVTFDEAVNMLKNQGLRP